MIMEMSTDLSKAGHLSSVEQKGLVNVVNMDPSLTDDSEKCGFTYVGHLENPVKTTWKHF